MNTLVDLVQTTIDGLLAGSAYALLALGFTLMFGVMRRLNLSFGAALMLGAYVAAWAHLRGGWGALPVALLTVAMATAAGVYIERLCFAPLRGRDAVASLVSSFAVWMQLEELATLLLPQHTNAFPGLADGDPLFLGPFHLRPDQIVMLVIAVALMILLWLGLRRTRFGLALRVLADEPGAAVAVGVDVRTVALVTFAIASALGGLAAFLILAGDRQVTPMFGMWATMKGLIAMMLGGLGSPPGAIAGGLLLGVIEAHAQWRFGPQVRDLIAYGLLFACLVWRPGGLMGQALADTEATARARL
jgi:branched-chain amino acid transport system permease protein